MSLPDLMPGVPPNAMLVVELRLLATTPNAFKVAVPFLGPDSIAPATAWLPRSIVTTGGASGRGFNLHTFSVPAWLYREMRKQLEPQA